MDYEDKWRQVLGNNLYKDVASNLGIDSNMNNQIAMHSVEMPISAEEARGIKHLLFKDGQGHIHDSWMQGFFFDQTIRYGLV